MTPDVATKIRDEAMALPVHWRELLLTNQLPVTRSLVRKLLGESRFVFYPQADGIARWYELGVTPSLLKFLEAVTSISKAVGVRNGIRLLWGADLQPDARSGLGRRLSESRSRRDPARQPRPECFEDARDHACKPRNLCVPSGSCIHQRMVSLFEDPNGDIRISRGA
jgi:hypothetical protein